MTSLERPRVLLSTRTKCGARVSRAGGSPKVTDDHPNAGGTPAPHSSLPRKRKCKPGIAKAEPSCHWRDGPGRWVADPNAGVRIGHTPSRWRRSETGADSAVRIACDGAMSLSASICAICGFSSAMSLCPSVSPCLCGSTSMVRWCDESICSFSSAMSLCSSVSLSLCGSSAMV